MVDSVPNFTASKYVYISNIIAIIKAYNSNLESAADFGLIVTQFSSKGILNTGLIRKSRDYVYGICQYKVFLIQKMLLQWKKIVRNDKGQNMNKGEKSKENHVHCTKLTSRT